MWISVNDYADEFKEAPVPVPTSFIRKVKDTHGTFTEWPKHLVSLMREKVNYLL